MQVVTYESKYSKIFHSKNLNEVKYDVLLGKAKLIRSFKNDISLTINSDLPKYSQMSKFDFIKHFNTQIPGLSGQDIQHAVVNVHVAYSNRFNQITSKVTFRTLKSWKAIFYKRKTANHIKGDLKEIKTTNNRATDLQKTLKFLTRFNLNDDVLGFVNRRLNENEFKSDDHKLFYEMVKFNLNKFTEERLLQLAISKRNRFVKRYSSAINFESLTFNSINRISAPILDYNKNYNSEINAFISLGNFNGVGIDIPVTYAKSYHNSIKLYQKGRNTSYTVTFNESKKKVQITLPIDGNIEVYIDGESPVGVDVNVKHNMFCLTNEETINYEKDIVADYAKFLKRLDKKNTRKKSMKQKRTLSKKDSKVYDKWKVRINDMLERKVVELIKLAKANDYDHIVLEDLSSMGKSFIRMDDFSGFKYSRFMSLLGIPALKSRIHSICSNYEVQCTFVQPHFTSQQCPICGLISKENRSCQEKFKCVNCEHEDNADVNAAINILKRVTVDVLRSKLLKQNKLQELVPRNLGKNKIFQILEAHDYEFTDLAL